MADSETKESFLNHLEMTSAKYMDEDAYQLQLYDNALRQHLNYVDYDESDVESVDPKKQTPETILASFRKKVTQPDDTADMLHITADNDDDMFFTAP